LEHLNNIKKLTMTRFKILLFLLFFGTMGVFAQTAKEDNVATYLKSNGSMQQYEFAYDQLLKMMQKNHPKTDANAEGWKYLKDNKSKAVSEMLGSLGTIYKKHFSDADIKEMLGFYRSAAAKQMLKDRTKMTEEHKAQLNSYYNSEIGKKIISKQQVLGQEIAKISEEWSRDLYETAVSLVK